MNDDTKTNEDYRRVLATANKLEAIQSNLESVIDFFLAPVAKLYYKLCNDCLKLLFDSEFKLDHFRKAEELVWKRIYHDIYRFQKTKCRVKKHDEYLVESHFISGIGFYSTLIIKLRTHYRINDVQGIIVPLNLTLGPLDNFGSNQRLNKDYHDYYETTTIEESSLSSVDNNNTAHQTTAREWAKQAIYRSLVYMGDLARYLLEISQFDYRKLSFDFYCSASRNQIDHGLPFNQLATLAGSSNHNLDAVCNYMRCCLRTKPFEGSEGNMKKIFEHNRKSYDSLSKTKVVYKISEVLASKDPSSAAELMMKSIIVTFIKLTSDLWTVISSDNIVDLMKDEILSETRVFFETLREALELEPIVPFITCNLDHEFCPISGGFSYSEDPRYVTPTIMYEFCSVSLMLIAKHQKSSSSQEGLSYVTVNSTYVKDFVNTLALNLLHYSTSKCQKMIMSRVQGLRINRLELNAYEKGTSVRASGLSMKSPGGNLSSSTINSISDSSNRRVLSRLRQRKAATNYSDSLNRHKHLTLHNEDFDMSELEETALSTIDALEISSDMSEEAENQINDLIDLDSSGDDQSTKHYGLPSNSSSFNNLSKPILRPTRSQNYELEKTLNSDSAPNSLPIPDLLTGDISERINPQVAASCQSPNESPAGSDVRYEKSPSALDKDSSQLDYYNEFESSMAFVYTQTYLPTIKVMCDWLLSSSDTISSNLQSFQSFRGELGDLVLLLKDLKLVANSRGSNLTSSTTALDISSSTSMYEQCDDHLIFKHVYSGPSWIQKYPLSCDFPLVGLSPLKSVHELNIDFNNQVDLTEPEAGAITTQCIFAFFHALTAFLENKDIH